MVDSASQPPFGVIALFSDRIIGWINEPSSDQELIVSGLAVPVSGLSLGHSALLAGDDPRQGSVFDEPLNVRTSPGNLAKVVLRSSSSDAAHQLREIVQEGAHRGAIERVSPAHVKGWLRKVGVPDPVDIELWANGKLLAGPIQANHYRGDLAAKMDGPGAFGFEFEDICLPAGAVVLAVREVAGEKDLLKARAHIERNLAYTCDVSVINRSRIMGWVAYQGWQSVTLALRIGDHDLDGTFPANKVQPGVSALSFGPYGFEIVLPTDMPQGEHVTIIDVERDVPIVHLPLPPAAEEIATLLPLNTPAASMAAASDPIIRLERMREGKLQGWAVSRLDPSAIFDVAIFINDVEFCRVRNDLPRPDLQRGKLSTGLGGFTVKIPLALRAKSALQIVAEALGGVRSPVFNMPQEGVHVPARAQTLRLRRRPVAVVIPVYNALDDLKACMESLLKYTPSLVPILLIDDGSENPELTRYLSEAAKLPNVRVIVHEKNKGYTATVNDGVAAAPGHDVVLLNSDARVTARWLYSMRDLAYSSDTVGTVTALSDNAGAFSAPEIGVQNPLPHNISEEDLARLVRRHSSGVAPEVPTGSGFCFYLRRDALDDVGAFDVEAFPAGYGEENDFSMRCGARGWLHLIDGSTYVYHERSKSFGDRRAGLVAHGRAIVDQRYPTYGRLIPQFRTSTSMRLVRYDVRKAFAAAERGERVLPRALYVYSTRSGGTPQTNEDLMQGLEEVFETWTLRCDCETLFLARYEKGKETLVCDQTLTEPVEPMTHRSREYDEIVKQWLVEFDFEIMHVRHLAWHSLGLLQTAKEAGLQVFYSFHDYYALCPTVKLLNGENKFCGGVCGTGDECTAELWAGVKFPPLRDQWLYSWRENFTEALRHCDGYFTTSPSAKALITSNLPGLDLGAMHVIEHGRSLTWGNAAAVPRSHCQPIRIAVPGGIDIAKGAFLLKEMAEADVERRFEFHVIGKCALSDLPPNVKVHGKYERSKINELLAKVQPSAGLVLSIWNETYCHVLTELWASGIPAVVLDYATVADRVRASGAGWVLPQADGATLVQQLWALLSDKGEWTQKVDAARVWQQSWGTANNIENMALAYLAAYDSALRNNRAVQVIESDAASPGGSGAIMTICPGGLRAAPPSTHIRVWERTINKYGRHNKYRRATPQDLLSIAHLNIPCRAVIQRNAVPMFMVDEFVRQAKRERIRYVFEIDDDLLNVPADKDADGTYRMYASHLEKLVAGAAGLIVSTPALEQQLGRLNSNIRVMPNKLSYRIWGEKVARSVDDYGSINVLYFGNRTHDTDLTLLIAAFSQAYAINDRLRLKVVGGFSRTPEFNVPWFESVAIPADARNYPEFVAWLKQTAADCAFGAAPLVKGEFNAFKSGLKLLELSALGLDGVYSDTPVYRELVEAGAPGTLCADDPRPWRDAILARAADLEGTRAVGEAARQWVLAEGMLNEVDAAEYDQTLLEWL
ncbi:glycosyltransferase [Hansschlegelia zhihuaiae]|nr:glycosyltransferase [Hansschlegelia zhihuaiae]